MVNTVKYTDVLSNCTLETILITNVIWINAKKFLKVLNEESKDLGLTPVLSQSDCKLLEKPIFL